MGKGFPPIGKVYRRVMVSRVSYQDDLKRHLADYKQLHLGISEPGVFQYRGREVREGHILPLAEADRNILEEARPEARRFLAEHPSKRHRYFHHLNSSQAFTFNLFFPYFYGGPEGASALLRALGREGVLDKCEAEAVPVLDELTNIDMLWTTVDGVQTLCEVKLSEADYGKAPDDAEHRDKLERVYAPLLAPHLEPGRLEEMTFFDAYQFNRNVWHLVREERNRLIFLLPRKNDVLWKQLQGLLLGVVPRTRGRISAVATEDFITKLSRDDRCPKVLREYADKLKQKYVI
jgi:hypothetical protein